MAQIPSHQSPAGLAEFIEKWDASFFLPKLGLACSYTHNKLWCSVAYMVWFSPCGSLRLTASPLTGAQSQVTHSRLLSQQMAKPTFKTLGLEGIKAFSLSHPHLLNFLQRLVSLLSWGQILEMAVTWEVSGAWIFKPVLHVYLLNFDLRLPEGCVKQAMNPLQPSCQAGVSSLWVGIVDILAAVHLRAPSSCFLFECWCAVLFKRLFAPLSCTSSRWHGQVSPDRNILGTIPPNTRSILLRNITF